MKAFDGEGGGEGEGEGGGEWIEHRREGTFPMLSRTQGGSEGGERGLGEGERAKRGRGSGGRERKSTLRGRGEVVEGDLNRD